MAAARTRTPRADGPAGLWHQPALLDLLADVLIVLGIAGLAWAGLAALQRLPVFPLREIVLTQAPQRVSAEQIAHAARTAVAGNFFTVDLAATRSAVEQLPWVRNAAVRRLWPDGLALTLEEHQAAAHWRHANGEPGLVNRHGEVFHADLAEDAPVLPRLSGPDGTAAELLARHGEFERQVAAIGRSVVAVSLSPRRAWRLRLDDGVVIELGRDEERQPLAQRLARFVAHYDGARARLGPLRVADLRYPNGFAVGGAPANPAPAQGRS
jgi:cell division protein FtsQ